MLRRESEEHVETNNSHSQIYQMTSTIIGLLTKRSTKVEPHPIAEDISQQHSKLTRPSLACSSHNSSNQNKSFAKCIELTSSRDKNNSAKIKTNDLKILSLTSTTIDVCANSHLDLSDNVLSIVRSSHKKNKSQTHFSSIDGSQSDGGEDILRKFQENRSLNLNRFSHQFSLCCKAEKRPLTPPVTVRYNSITTNDSLCHNTLSMSWNMEDISSLSSNSDNLCSRKQHSPIQISNPKLMSSTSAPVSPIANKVQQNSYNSPFHSSVKSATTSCPIRPIAVSECRSRLRLKLYPPEKSFKGTIKPAKENDLFLGRQLPKNNERECAFPIEKRTKSNFLSNECIKIDQNQSNTGLARQALMAAQVLSLMPTEKARERNILDGRFGISCLLGPSELNRILPDKEVTIFVGTWNMNGQNPPKQMSDFVLPATVDHIPDIVAIGTQESSPDRFEWEVSLQETLGPSHVLFHSTTLGTLHLAVYMRRDLIWYCSAPEDANMSVRTGSAFRTKGAVAISFCLFGTSMLFVTSHLTAHQQKVKERVSDVKRIIHALDLPRNLNLRHKNKDVTQNFDNVFWCGDLNFRLSEPREKLLEWIQNTKFPLPSHLPHGYMHTDQLSSVLSDGAAFRGFMEANITFPPTYKYDPGTQHFDTSSKQRAPAYTDRILYKFRQTQGLVLRRQSAVQNTTISTQPFVQCLLYDSVPSIITSDHKPVWALFKTVIRAGADSIPLAAGLFSRDIYLEGMKRRLNNQYTGSSAVCIIQ